LLLSFVAFCGRIDKNHDMKIDWVEWRDYFVLRHAESLEEILKLWRRPPVCIAANLFIPYILNCIFCIFMQIWNGIAVMFSYPTYFILFHYIMS